MRRLVTKVAVGCLFVAGFPAPATVAYGTIELPGSTATRTPPGARR